MIVYKNLKGTKFGAFEIKVKNRKKLDRKGLCQLIDDIIIFDNGNIKINYKEKGREMNE